ncbi:ArsR/SmtB family transcription factor [Kitasatospora sp. NPDC051853]|uniref:ArsR/SmtB family transcription factor n=1 Tax=Kitasatospora sp. NPDC051853 TaxID=3364058 RepID=UPI0037B5654E
MLRFHFTGDDALRIRVAAEPHPLWDIACSLQLLHGPRVPPVFELWRTTVRRRLGAAGLAEAVRSLAPLYPADSYPPDFLTGGHEVADLEAGLDLLMSTPRRRLREEMLLLAAGGRRFPARFRPLADGEPLAVSRLGELLRRYHEVAIRPFAAQMEAAFTVDRALRARTVLEGGVEGLLGGYRRQGLRWSDGVLEAPCPVEADFEVGGRPMTLLPSFFASRTMAVADPGRPPLLAYPVDLAEHWLASSHGPSPDGGSLRQLIGPSRAETLVLLQSAHSTTELAGALKTSLSTASRNAAALRRAGLIRTTRDGRRVLHRLSPAGRAFLRASGN